jgi:GR25 family glycosyltransferase involved in LPS biosynthesis
MEHTLYINLKQRRDRRQQVESQLESIGVTGERMEAVYCKQGGVGCAMSHIQCLEYAKSQKWSHVFICEDDIEFTNPSLLKSQLATFLQSNIAWDVLLVGANLGPPFDKESGCLRVFNAQTTTGYIVKNHYYDTLIQSFQQSVGKLIENYQLLPLYAIDIHWKKLQQRDRWYILYPLTVIQTAGHSDIEQKKVNYSARMLDSKELKHSFI